MNLKFDFEFVETKFLSVWGRAPCKFYGCQAWGHLLQGTAAGGSTTFSINALGRAMLKNKTWIEMPPSIDGRVCSMCRKTRDQLNIVTFQKYAWPVAATGQFYGILSRLSTIQLRMRSRQSDSTSLSGGQTLKLVQQALLVPIFLKCAVPCPTQPRKTWKPT